MKMEAGLVEAAPTHDTMPGPGLGVGIHSSLWPVCSSD